MVSCNNRVNPFLEDWDTPYGIPPYDKITVADYIPAIEAGIKQQAAEIDAITNNPDEPTFENTIVPLELSGSILAKVSGVLYNVSETDQTPELDKVQEDAIPLLSDHEANIDINLNRAADPDDLTLLQRPEENGLRIKRHLADFI